MCDDLRSLSQTDYPALQKKTAIRRNRCNAECRTYKNEVTVIYVFSSPITATAKATAHGLVAAFVLPLPPRALLCVYKRGIMVAGCVSAAGYFVFGGEDMANQTTSHMKGSSRSI